MTNQRTLKNIISTSGIGLHSGKKVNLSLNPAPVDTGIVFRRIDANRQIKSCAKCVGDTSLSTTLIDKKDNNVKVSTIEHLMAAFAGVGVDNAFIDIDAEEVPIMDGSADPFVFLIKSAGLVEQSKKRKFIKILKPIEIVEGDKSVRLEPYNGFRINFSINFKHPAFKSSNKGADFELNSATFMEEISRARTFGFIKDVEELHKRGLAKGASLDNSVGLDEYRILNEDGLRYKNEFVRHKILDAMGDLYLLGCPIIGSFYGVKSGHKLNNMLIRKLLKKKKSWKYVNTKDETMLPELKLVPNT